MWQEKETQDLSGLRILSNRTKGILFYAVVNECVFNKFTSQEDYSTLMTKSKLRDTKSNSSQSLGGGWNNFYSE